jgi:hypothetical protein
MKLGVREAIVSPAVFAAVLLMLVSFDDRVKDRFANFVSSGDGIAPWSARLGDLAEAMMSAVRYQSIENAPLLVFASVGAVLMLFMFRT